MKAEEIPRLFTHAGIWCSGYRETVLKRYSDVAVWWYSDRRDGAVLFTNDMAVQIIYWRMTEWLRGIHQKIFEVVFWHILTGSKCLNYATIRTLILIWHFRYKKWHYYYGGLKWMVDNYFGFTSKNSKFYFLLQVSAHTAILWYNKIWWTSY